MRIKLTVIPSILASLAMALTLGSFNPAAAQAGAPPIPTPAVTVMPDPPQSCDPAGGFPCPGMDGLLVVRGQPQPASGGLKAADYLWQQPVAWTFIRPQNDLYFFSDTDGWTVGPQGDVIRWDGSTTHWYGINGVTANLNAIDMVSPSDGWVVGEGGTILHWNGVSWQPASSPTSASLSAIDMVSANDGWIVGGENPNPVILRWNSSSWNPVAVPAGAGGILLGVDMLSSTDGWIVGALPGTILHWDGSAWQSVTSPTSGYLNDIDMLSATDGWAVGNSGSYTNGAVIHWNGSSWQNVSLPAGVYELEDLSMDSASDGWAVSWWGTHLIHWDGATWTKVNTVGRMHAIQMFSTTDGWGVGRSVYHYAPFYGIKIHVARADGAPAAGASITLLGADGSLLNVRYVSTDSSGDVAITVPSGTYNLLAYSSSDHFFLWSRNVTVPNILTLSAVGQPVITLAAKKRDGTPLGQAQVSIGLNNLQSNMPAVSLGQVDANGQMVFTVMPGTYDVSVSDMSNLYYLVKGAVPISAAVSLNFDASTDPTAEVAISHPGETSTDVVTKPSILNCGSGFFENMTEGSRIVLTGNQMYSVGQNIVKTAGNGDNWWYWLDGPATLWPAGETLTSTAGGNLSARIRTEPAVVGSTVELTSGLFDSYNNQVTDILKQTPPSTWWSYVNPQVELFDPQNNLLKQDASYTYPLPRTAALGMYKVYYWQSTGPYQGDYGTMGTFDVGLPSVSAVIPAGGGTLTSTVDSTAYDFPAGTFSNSVEITHTTSYSPVFALGLGSAGHNFNVTAVYSDTGQPAQPLGPYTITISYIQAELGGTDEASLAIYYWDGSQWVKEPTSAVDTAANTVTATPDHFSQWAVLGETNRLYLPLARR